jgi:predicted esterase
MVSVFRGLADQYGFIIVAPDSRRSPDGQLTWQVGDHPGDLTDDVRHTMACVDAVRSMAGVQINSERTLIAGFSGGGSSAPYISSNESLFRSFAVLHGGIIPNGFGGNRVRGWFSTGESDSVRPVAGMRGAMEELRREGWSADLELSTYPGGHDLGETEKRELIRWWLGR